MQWKLIEIKSDSLEKELISTWNNFMDPYGKNIDNKLLLCQFWINKGQ